MKRSVYILALSLCFVITNCENKSSHIVFHKSHEPSRLNTPFSDVVEVNGLLFLTGQIGKDHKSGDLAEGGIKAETKQVIENIQAVLQHHNLELDNVVKCTVILKDINDFASFNEVYVKYFTKKPARTTFAASALAGNASIEIDVIAAK
ncbi:2-iminobutanoate/2-iminopropanoate deaminase [Flavobacteriaceae bacterium MAR_2010_72]|nr:2-iminobutanoate/2-iminopropanoate deaminase [Flavobacteriaceae bacterium MAR_2010_72]TVZ57580.1 2-iminobutanoate/2-iminopropanoate deaminase [Flavobacteriaceae bacterium MAR_2010_105]